MDSITQATLGAAVGYAVLGKKLGNKAILVGAIAGTIPDLDIFSRLFLEHEVYGLVYHRGISHSILFTLLASPFFAWLSLQYYERAWNKKLGVQASLAIGWSLFYAAILVALGAGVYYSQSWIVMGIFALFLAGALPLYRSLKWSILHREEVEYQASFGQWTLMYGLAIFTHWLIDACTSYGTQIFEPFSNYRVAFNNISIIDPLYTVPMLLGLMAVLFVKNEKTKAFWNYMGIGLASLYMVSTFYSKSIMNQVVADNLKAQGIEYSDYITYPALLNTILWQTTVEADDAFYYGTYSLLDKEPKITFTKLPKNHDLIEKYHGEGYLEVLLWFSNGYYNINETADGKLIFNNLRFGLMGMPEDLNIAIEDRYIFRFALVEKDGQFDVQESRNIDKIQPKAMLAYLWERIKGI